MSDSDQQNSGRHEPTPFEIDSRPLGLKNGFDPDRMNQLLDELQLEEAVRKLGREFGPHPNP